MNDILITQQQYLTFVVCGEEYAVAILRVREIIAFDSVTRVPRTPAFIRGVINLRGSVVPVIDLARKFGHPPSPSTSSTCIVIVELTVGEEGREKQIVLGLLVDSVSQVIDLAPDDIQPPPSFGTPVDIAYLVGMGRSGKKFVLLLDIDKVLAANEILTAVEAAAPAGEDVA
jgi:purine-binding chemotaxis protein CheW